MTHTNNPTDTNQASEDEPRETIERLLRFNCPDGCNGNGSYPEMSSDGEWEQGKCQWCFEYGMPARDAIQSIIRTENLKLLGRLDKQIEYNKHDMGEMGEFIRTIYAHNAIEAERTKLEAEL